MLTVKTQNRLQQANTVNNNKTTTTSAVLQNVPSCANFPTSLTSHFKNEGRVIYHEETRKRDLPDSFD
jgi:N-acetylmuramic acid 6-phosphate (MurNAc-6-P) etherase